MILQDVTGRTYTAVRKFGDSRLPADDSAEDQHSLARLYLSEGQLLVPAGNGMFKVEETNEVLTVVER
jgi:hypothetical protein